MTTNAETAWDTELAECAEVIVRLYNLWPTGHPCRDLVPGVLATLLVDECVDDPEEGEVREFFDKAFALAGFPGHPHSEIACRAAVELNTIAD